MRVKATSGPECEEATEAGTSTDSTFLKPSADGLGTERGKYG